MKQMIDLLARQRQQRLTSPTQYTRPTLQVPTPSSQPNIEAISRTTEVNMHFHNLFRIFKNIQIYTIILT